MPGRYVAALLGQSGWIGHDGWIASGPGSSPTARLAWSTIATVYLDPCHWQTSTLGMAAPPLMRDQDGLTAALNAWWAHHDRFEGVCRLHATILCSDRDDPAEGGPVERASRPGARLDHPGDLDLAACDGGEYRLWETRDGTPRTAGPGERLRLDVTDFEPGLLVREMSWLPTASPAVLDQARDSADSLWIGRPPT